RLLTAMRARLSGFEELDLAARAQCHDGLLPGRATAEVPAHPLLLAEDDLGPDVGDLHLEDRLDRLPDLHLVGVHRHLEGDLVVRVLQRARLLGHQGAQHDLARVSHDWSASCRRSSAARSKITRRWRRSSATDTCPGRTTLSQGTLRLPRSSASVTLAT